jgi:hypothetical protein
MVTFNSYVSLPEGKYSLKTETRKPAPNLQDELDEPVIFPVWVGYTPL